MPITTNWPGCEGLRPVQTLKDKKQEKCKTNAGLFGVLDEKSKPQHNKTLLSLQYCKLVREEKGSAEKLMGWLRVKATKMTIKKEMGDYRKIY